MFNLSQNSDHHRSFENVSAHLKVATEAVRTGDLEVAEKPEISVRHAVAWNGIDTRSGTLKHLPMDRGDQWPSTKEILLQHTKEARVSEAKSVFVNCLFFWPKHLKDTDPQLISSKTTLTNA